MNAPRDLAELHERASRPPRDVVELLSRVTGTVLVLGAGGKMGFHLSLMIHRGLAAAGVPARVVAVSRFGSPGATDPFHEEGIETLAGDLTDSVCLAGLPESGTLFFLAGVKFGTHDQPDLLRRMNVDLPRAVAVRYPDARVVALSTGCVYDFVSPSGGGSVEEDALGERGAYAVSCRGREAAFADSRGSLVRLNYAVDLRYGVLVDIARKVAAGLPVDVTTGHVNVIWQGDANAYILRSLGRCSVPPFVVNVTGRATLNVRDVAHRFGELFERPVAFTGTEAQTAWISNASKALRLWGPPAVDEWTLVEWVADWLGRGGETLDKPTHFDVRDGTF